MIRPFDWRDLSLLSRVRSEGVCLDSQLAYTRGQMALHTAFLETLRPRRRVFTFVERPEDPHEPAAIGQFVLRNDRTQARLALLSPESSLATPVGARLLDGLAEVAGSYRVQSLIAEVEEVGPLFEQLRRAGFAVYARQRIWRLDHHPETADSLDRAWRVESERDAAAIQNLYLNLIPALVQQVEPAEARIGRGLVYWASNELMGYLDVERGPRGVWIQPYLHPAAELTDQLLAGFVQVFTISEVRPLFVCVRSYQGGLDGPLERLGFQPCSNQAVMVKRLTAPIRDRALNPIPTLEGTQAEPTAPFAQLENGASTSTKS